MSPKMRTVRFFGAIILLIGLAIQFQNCAVGGGEGGALQLGSNGSQGNTDGGTSGGTTGGTSGGTTTGTPTCTCPSATTVNCGQAVMNSCGVACGVGTNGCTPNCANVNPSCMTGSNQYRYNGGGGGCGSGPNCDANGNIASGDCQDCPCRSCN